MPPRSPNPALDSQTAKGITELVRKLVRRHVQVSVVGGGGGSGLGESDVTTLIDNNSYVTIQDEGTPLTQRNTINFIGATVTAADDAGNTRTNVTISAAPASGAYDTVQEEGTPLTQRTDINFIGPAITAADNAGNTRTDVTVTSMPGPSAKGTGCIFGSIHNTKPSSNAYTPFSSSSGATPTPSITEDFICPATGWVYNMAVRHADETSANGVTYRLGLQVNGVSHFDGVIQPQAAAGASTIGDVVFTRVNRGDNLKGVYSLTGASENTSFGPWSAEFLGDGGESILGGQVIGSAGGTIYVPMFGHGNTATEANARTPMIAGTLKWVYLKLNEILTGNAGQSATLTILKNGSPTSIVVTVPVDGPGTSDGGIDNTVWADLTNTAVFAEDDTISAQVSVSHASVGALQAQISMAFVPDEADTVFMVGAFQDNQSAAAFYPPPWVRGNGTWAQTEANSMLVMPRAATLPADALRVYVYSVMTFDNIHTWTVRKNASNEDIVITLNAAAGTGTKVSTGTPVNFAMSDILSIESVGVSGTNGGASGAIGGWSLKINTAA